MLDIWIAFITGLTTGGLSCMAVQGGLLTSSLANQIEKDVQAKSLNQRTGLHLAAPITVFLVAKLIMYTLFGALLGVVGSSLALTPSMRAILQFAIGIFMIGNALRLFNVHPIFRYFTFEPPSFVTRFIRKSSKGKTAFGAPAFLGAMTVLIPCGIAQSMMAAALGTANLWNGAAIMFAFTLGTTPVFFVLAYTAVRIGSVMDKYFMRVVAVVLLILGIYAFDTGLNLAGSPFSLSSTVQDLVDRVNPPAPTTTLDASDPEADLVLHAMDDGYEPRILYTTANKTNKLKVVTENTLACTLAFTIPELNIAVDLPVTGKTLLDLPPQPKGKAIRFSCSMGMYPGQIIFQ